MGAMVETQVDDPSDGYLGSGVKGVPWDACLSRVSLTSTLPSPIDGRTAQDAHRST
jgi:hypothetical protein